FIVVEGGTETTMARFAREVRALPRCLRAWMMAALCTGVVVCSVGTSVAQDASAELANNPDFRVRVTAALAVARPRPPNARPQPQRALDDPHPAVRAAAAAALGTLGDPDAIPALQRKAGTEGSGSVRAQMQASIATLQRGGGGDSTT